MYTSILNEIEKAFDGFRDDSFSSIEGGYVGPLSIKEEEDAYIVEKVIVGFGSESIKANVRKSILRVAVNDESVLSLRIDPDYLDATRIRSNLKNGILKIEIPKSENSKDVEIPIS